MKRRWRRCAESVSHGVAAQSSRPGLHPSWSAHARHSLLPSRPGLHPSWSAHARHSLLHHHHLLLLASPLPSSERLTCLLAGAIVSDLMPETGLLVLLEEPAVHLANCTHDGTGDGRLVVLSGLEVGATARVDQIAEATVAWVDVRATASAAQDVIAACRT